MAKKKARKKNVYRCFKCKKSFGSSPQSAQHFAKYPTHRTAKQAWKHASNMRAGRAMRQQKPSAHRRRSAYDVLPTVKQATRRGSGLAKYCTDCGTRRFPSHSYCGGCGNKL